MESVPTQAPKRRRDAHDLQTELKFWRLPDGDITWSRSEWEEVMGSVDPESAETKGPFFPLWRPRLTKDFEKYLEKTKLTKPEDAEEFNVGFSFSSIECKCCYLRSINQCVDAMHPLCPLCNAPTPKCETCRDFSVRLLQSPERMSFLVNYSPNCFECGSKKRL